jgi:hypothetical protein
MNTEKTKDDEEDIEERGSRLVSCARLSTSKVMKSDGEEVSSVILEDMSRTRLVKLVWRTRRRKQRGGGGQLDEEQQRVGYGDITTAVGALHFDRPRHATLRRSTRHDIQIELAAAADRELVCVMLLLELVKHRLL